MITIRSLLGVFVLLIFSTISFGQNLYSVDYFDIVDSNGKKVGRTQGPEGNIYWAYDGNYFQVRTGPEGIHGSDVFFPQLGCTGTPHMFPDYHPEFENMAGVVSENIYLRVDPNATPTLEWVYSIGNATGCLDLYDPDPNYDLSYQDNLVPAYILYNISGIFVPPLRIKVDPQALDKIK